MCKISVLIVVYNRCITECAALTSLSAIKDIDIYVADNSTRDMGNEALAAKAGYTYINMGGNMGLSKAYNAVIDRLDKHDGLICLFDDDTTFGPEYFEKLRADAKKFSGINLFAPVVRDANGMLSPCIFKGLRGRRAAGLPDIPQMNMTVINSGLAIRTKVFETYRYDENLFLDYVDHAFIRDTVQHDKCKIHILDVTIDQQFSGSTKQSHEDAMRRYGIFKKDALYFGSKYSEPKWKVWLLLMRRRLKLLL